MMEIFSSSGVLRYKPQNPNNEMKPNHKLRHITRLLLVSTSTTLTMLSVAIAQQSGSDNGVTVFGAPNADMLNLGSTPVDGFKKSPYTVTIKKSGITNAATLTPYVYCMQLDSSYTSGPEHYQNKRYYESNWGCSHSYVNFQTNGPVEVSVTSSAAFDANTTELHPKRYLTQMNGKDYVLSNGNKTLTFTLSGPGNIVVDVNGQVMSKFDYNNVKNGPFTHPISIHATNVLSIPTSPAIVDVEPGNNTIPIRSDEVTFKFKPGIHNVGSNFKVHPNQKFHIPGDAVVFGTFNNADDAQYQGRLSDAIGVVFQGNGTISGTKLNHWEMDPVKEPILVSEAVVGTVKNSGPHPQIVGKPNNERYLVYSGSNNYSYNTGSANVYNSDKNDNTNYGDKNTDGSTKLVQHARYKEQQRISYKKNTIELNDCLSSRVEGIVILNPANHGLKLFTAKKEITKANKVKHVKIIGFRVNSDGGGINDSSEVEDCFYRVQDDGFYPKGITLKNNVLWSDANGASLRLDALKDAWPNSVFENIDVIFRKNLTSFSNSAAIEMPETSNKHTVAVTFKNINITDRVVTKPMINLVVGTGGELANVTFKDITIASDNVKNKLEVKGTGSIHDLTFDNVKIKGETLTEFNFPQYFEKIGTNIYNIKFGATSTPTGTELPGALPRNNWQFDASSNLNLSSLVRDGVRTMSSRWDGGDQNPNQYFTVNMGGTFSINKIVLDNTGSPGDHPRSYSVETKLNSGAWETVVGQTANTTDGALTISFGPKNATEVRIKQLADNGAAYFYWSISELNIFGTGTSSNPLTLTGTNVGSAGGSSSLSGSTWTLQSSGSDIYNSPDTFHFVQQQKSGDATIIAKVESLGSAPSWARAGIMIRDDLGVGSNYVMVCVTPGNGIQFQTRTSGTGSGLASMSTQNSNVFLKLQKAGTTYNGWISTDGGNTWGTPKSVTIPNMNTYNIGIIASGHSGAPITATISNLSIN